MILRKKNGLGGILAFVSCLLFFSSSLSAQETKEVSPYDFYQGMELELDEVSSPFAWVELPTDTYINSAYPRTLQDARVFNGTGQEVPSVLFYDTEQSVSTSKVTFKFQRLLAQMDNVNSNDDDRWKKQYLLVEAIPSKVSRIALPKMQRDKETAYQAYLLTREQPQDGNSTLQNVILDWAKNEQDWQAKVFIYASADKENWVNIAADQPIMNLKLSSGTIASNNIALLDGNAEALNSPYLLVIILSASDASMPDLQKVSAETKVLNSVRRQQVFQFEMTNDGISREHVIYQLPTAQPLSELSITLQQDNRVIPLKIEYSLGKDDNWLPLTNFVAFSQNTNGDESHNANIVLNNELIRKIKITAMKGSWDDLPPRIEGRRDAINLIFNIQGASPYLLVWGSKQAQLEKLTYSELVGHAYSIKELMNQYPEVDVSNKVLELGGAEQLTNAEIVDDVSTWVTITLWIVLFAGIIILLYFCWYLLKEVNSSGKKNTEE